MARANSTAERSEIDRARRRDAPNSCAIIGHADSQRDSCGLYCCKICLRMYDVSSSCCSRYKIAILKVTLMPVIQFGTQRTDTGGFISVAVLWILCALSVLVSIYAVYVLNAAAAFATYDKR